MSQDRVLSKNEPQTHFKARRRILKYALDAYLKKTFKVADASYLDYVKLFAEAAGLEYANE